MFALRITAVQIAILESINENCRFTKDYNAITRL